MLETENTYSMAIRQMIAECYLEGVREAESLRERLLYGNNHYLYNANALEPLLQGKVRLTVPNVDRVIDQYLLIDHHQNDSSGFSATLLLDVTNSEYSISFRSTEYRNQDEGGDFERDGGFHVDGADGEIFQYGFALAQLVAMERYYRQVRSILPEDAVLNVTGYSLGGHLATVFTQLHSDDIGQTYLFNSPGRGDVRGRAGVTEAEVIRRMLARIEELIVNPSAGIAFPLGGTPELTLFQAAKTRAEQDPGWNPFLAGSADSIYEDPRYRWARYVAVTEFGPDYALRGDVLDGEEFSRTISIVGVATHGDATLVASSQNHVSAEYVFIEDQPTWDEQGGLGGMNGDYGTTHSLTLIVDSLALQQLISKLDPSLEQRQIEGILAASSFQRASGFTLTAGEAEADSLENALDALYHLLGGSGEKSPIDRQTGAFGNVASREFFYRRLVDVENLASVVGSTLKIETLVGKAAWEIVREADGSAGNEQRALAYRYALEHLNPFVVLGANYEVHNERNELTSYGPLGEDGRMSAEWIRDRAALLVALNEARLGNRETPGPFRSAEAATGRVLFSSSEDPEARLIVAPSGYFLSTQFVTFDGVDSSSVQGDALDDSLYGGGGDDHLSGFGGMDTLEGGVGVDTLKGGGGADLLRGGAGIDNLYGESGEDRLEGGADEDVLEGGDDSDRLYGGEAADYLDGGAGNDHLEGGKGNDIYVYRSGGGVDTIVDLDGSGRVVIDGRALTSPVEGFQRVGNTWLGGAPDHRYSLYLNGVADGSGVLTVSGSFQGQLRIENFRNGDLGITLGDLIASEPELPPTATIFYLDDIEPGVDEIFGTSNADHAIATTDFVSFYGLGGNDVLGQVGSSEHERLIFVGNAGNDTLIGSDEAESSSGGDWLWGGGGADSLYGGEHDDHLLGDLYVELHQDRFKADFFTYSPTFRAEYGGGYYWYSQTGDQIDRDFNLGADFELALSWVLGVESQGNLNVFYDDFLDGGEGDDVLEGMAGSDRLYGGNGDDRLTGDTRIVQDFGSNLHHLAYLLGRFGDDYLDGGEGDDHLTDEVAGNDVLIGGEGNDSIVNRDRRTYSNAVDKLAHLASSLDDSKIFHNYLDGGAGNDVLETRNEFNGGSDVLVGGTGNDTLIASSSNGTIHLIGGAGDDDFRMSLGGKVEADGGAGNDIYSLGWFDDRLFQIPLPQSPGFIPGYTIRDVDSVETVDTLKLSLLGFIDQLTIVRVGNDLLLGTGTRRDWLTMEDWFLGNAWKIEKIEIRSLASTENYQLIQTNWDIEELESRAVWQGTDGPDYLVGNDTNQIILAGDGDDIIDGGVGDDVINGGNGNNVFWFGANFGQDRVVNDETRSGGSDQIVFEETGSDELLTERVGNDLRLGQRGTSSIVTLADWFSRSDGHVRSIRFSDGTLWTAMQLRDRALGNHAPIVTRTVDGQLATKGEFISFQLPPDLFMDPDPGDVLSLDLTLGSGGPLPSWLAFDPKSHTLSGLMPATQEAALRLKVIARDRIDSEASIEFDLIPRSANSTPVVLQGLNDQLAFESVAFDLVIPDEAFHDHDFGDALAYSVTLANGDPLPSWLSFNALNRKLSGVPGENDIGTLTGRVTATDIAGQYVSDSFQIVVQGRAGVLLIGEPGSEVLTGFSGDDRIDGGGGADLLYGKRGNDFLTGGAGSDQLIGESGNDVLFGGAGPDNLVAGEGRDLLFGGDGNDVLASGVGAGNSIGQFPAPLSMFLVGGLGDDTIQVGGAAAIIGFNAGDGRDVVRSGPGAQISLSLGKQVGYQKLALSREGTDLRLHIGDNDRMTFLSWYSSEDSRTVKNLQFVLGGSGAGGGGAGLVTSHRVETFDFQMIVNQFDIAAIDQWSLTEALLDAHLSGSDSEALGGDLAYRYGTGGMIDRLPSSSIQNVLTNPLFGTEPQSISVPPSAAATPRFSPLSF